MKLARISFVLFLLIGSCLAQAPDTAPAPVATNTIAPVPDASPDTNVPPVNTVEQAAQNHAFQIQLDLAREQHRSKDFAPATRTLVALLETNAPAELKRPVLLELALVTQDNNEAVKAQQIYAQYIHLYPNDPTVPEVLLRQGLLYRQMGINTLALSKFYAVMSSALKLKLDDMDYYKKLVLHAQTEIAETYYLDGQYAEASDFFNRLLKAGISDLDRPQIQFKLIRSLSFQTNYSETVARAQNFLDTCANSADVPEVRFLLATTLKKLGRNSEAMKQTLLLLQSQEDNVKKNPEVWVYWQQRAGNEIANQLYKEGDYFNALQIYLSLADLNQSVAWQLPVWYQTALIYEQLQQWEKATRTYDRIIARQKELTDPASNPSLASIFDMAKWRKDYIDWMQKAKISNQAYQPRLIPTNAPADTATPIK